MYVNQVINQNIAIHCKTREEAQRIINLSCEAKCFWLGSSNDEVKWPYQEDTCYRLSSRITYGSRAYFEEESFEVVDSTEILDDVWVKESDHDGLYWVTRDFKEAFFMYSCGVTANDYWYLPIPNSTRPILRKLVDISVLNFRNKLYTKDGLPIDVDHYVCYNDRVQVVDVNGKVFNGPFYE